MTREVHRLEVRSFHIRLRDGRELAIGLDRRKRALEFAAAVQHQGQAQGLSLPCDRRLLSF
jgi:hypothetical protein